MSLKTKALGLSIVICSLLLAQSTPRFEACGLGTAHHDCRCLDHTQRVRQAFIDDCQRTSKSDAELDACLKRMPAHCDLANRYVDWNGDGESTDIPMAERCTMACKKSDCKCDDGPTCHFEHRAEDHGSK